MQINFYHSRFASKMFKLKILNLKFCSNFGVLKEHRRVLWIAGNPDAWGVGEYGFVLLCWGLIQVKGGVFGWLGVLLFFSLTPTH